MSPSTSDKENASPEQTQQPPKILASQAALKEKLGENTNSQYYDPFQPPDMVRNTTQQYRRLLRETNGTLITSLR